MSWRCRLRFVPHTSGACSISDSGREILVLICRVKGSLYCCYLVQVGFIVFTLGLFFSSKLSFWGGEHRRVAGRWNCLTFPIAVDFNHTLDVTEGPTLSFNSGFHTSSVLTVYGLHPFSPQWSTLKMMMMIHLFAFPFVKASRDCWPSQLYLCLLVVFSVC